MHDERKWCVYVHISPSEKCYIGITSQKTKDRWRNGNGYKSNQYFSRAIQKYGWDSFKHEIIVDGLSEEEAKLTEIALIHKYNTTNPLYGYNISHGGSGTVGVRHFGEDNPFYGKHHTEETREKMRQNHYDMTGENNPFYNKHHSNETIQHLSYLAKQRDISHLNTPFTEERRLKIGELHGKIIQQFDLDMNLIYEFPSMRALESIGYRRASIRDVCSGRKDSYKGFIWKYKNPCDNNESGYKPGVGSDNIYCTDEEMNLISVYKSYSEASRKTGVTRKQISKSCNSERHLFGKYNWFLKDDYEKLKEGA